MQNLQSLMLEIERRHCFKVFFDQARVIEQHQHNCSFTQRRITAFDHIGPCQAVRKSQTPANCVTVATTSLRTTALAFVAIKCISAIILPPLPEKCLRSVTHFLAIMASNVLICDASGDFTQARFQFRTAFRRIKYSRCRFACPDHVNQWPGITQNRIKS